MTKARHSIYSKYLKYFSRCQKYLFQEWVYFYENGTVDKVLKKTPLTEVSVGE